MALHKGIKVQPSRFAALQLESDSESGEEELFEVEWHQVGGKSRSKGGAPPSQQKDGPPGARQLSKSAKKRARKKRNQQSTSESAGGGGAGGKEGGSGGAGEVDGGGGGAGGKEGGSGGAGGVDGGGGEGQEGQKWEKWQEKDTEAADLAFHKELEEALLQSKLTAEQEDEIDKQRKAAVVLKKQNKKGVTLSLQALHRVNSEPEVQSPKTPEVKKDDSAFFERLEQEVESEMKRGRPEGERKISESLMSPVEESARVAHVMDKLEKRDKIIAVLQKENEALKSKLKEVKGRNQQLCKILGQGEISSKTQLLEQIEALTSVESELTTEMETLHSALEQERSRNKSLQAELAKQASKTGKSRHN